MVSTSPESWFPCTGIVVSTTGMVALCCRNSGSQTPDRWLKRSRNTHCKEEATNRRSELENKAKLCERIDQINYINTINVTINIICITLLIVLCVYLNKQGNILWMDFSNIIIAYSIIALSPTLIMEIALTVGSIEKYIK